MYRYLSESIEFSRTVPLIGSITYKLKQKTYASKLRQPSLKHLFFLRGPWGGVVIDRLKLGGTMREGVKLEMHDVWGKGGGLSRI